MDEFKSDRTLVVDEIVDLLTFWFDGLRKL